MAFLEYLKSLKSTLKSLDPTTEVCVTSGNESCDLDSIVCALVYAYYKNTKGSSDEINLPILQCSSEEFELNKEAMMVFDMIGLDPSWLLYANDVSSDVLSAMTKLSLVLVDHNTPTGMLAKFSSSVIKIIDHHEKSHSLVNEEGISTTIEMVGSCASLVARELLNDRSCVVEEPVAILLLSAILLDTGNLKAEKRVNKTDKVVSEELAKILPSSFNCSDHYTKLFNARFDISTLSINQVLRKDYKECQVNKYTIGFCSIPALLSEFLSQSDINANMIDFLSSHKLDVLILLGISISDSACILTRRQIAVFQPHNSTSDFPESIINVLEVNDDLRCKRVEPVLESFSGTLLEQENTKMSRKHIIPIVSSFVTSVESEYPRTSLSPPPILLEEGEVTSPAVLGVATDQPFPLEPNITISSSLPSVETKKASSKAKPKPIPEYSSAEEFKERRSHRIVNVGGEEIVISLNMVEPYKKIIQHAGYIGETRQALIVISACYLPPKSLPNYNHVIHHTFYYVLSVLDKLIVDDYVIVYLHSGAPRNSMPSLPTFHKFYRTIDRRLRKQLTQLFIVHPTFWVKTMLRLARPFISTKFWRKVHFIPTLQDLTDFVKLDDDYIAAPVVAVDKLVMSKRHSSHKYETTPSTTDNDSVKEK